MRGLILPALLLLGACNTGTSPDLGDALGNGTPFPGAADTCGASHLQGLIGQDASAANGAVFTGEFEVLYPGMTSGAMFHPDRTLVKVDAQNRITRVNCG